MKRVLIFSTEYIPYASGAELAVRDITDRLSPEDYQFDLVAVKSDKDLPDKERIGNINVYRVGFRGRLGRYFYPILADRLAKKLHQEKPYDIVWSIMAAYAAAAGLFFKNQFKAVKFLLTLQEGDSIEHIHKQVRGFKGQWRRVFKEADYIQAISKFLKDWARAEGATCPVEVIPNGVDLKKFTPSDSPQIKSDVFKIITTSRLVVKNGVDILVEAAARLKKLIPNRKFVIEIIGSGTEAESLKKLAKDLGVLDVVNFVGNVPHEEIPDYLGKADIFVRPSRSEGLGTSFLEAAACGLPIVGTAVGGVPDFLKDGETGLFMKINNPGDLAKVIANLIQNKTLREKLAINGERLVKERYDWDKIAKDMDQIFQKLLIT